MMADVIHGMMLDGRKLALPNTSLDQDWTQIEVSDPSLQNAGVKCFYRVLNGVLYVKGKLAVPTSFRGSIYALKSNDKWNFPAFGYGGVEDIVANEGSVPSTLVHFDISDATDKGYMIYVAYNGDTDEVPLNFSIPVI